MPRSGLLADDAEVLIAGGVLRPLDHFGEAGRTLQRLRIAGDRGRHGIVGADGDDRVVGGLRCLGSA